MSSHTAGMEAELYTELGESADRLEIPWASPDDPANRYFDLKSRPQDLAQLAEARDCPALGEFLRHLNAPSTLFATAKCATWETPEFSPRERRSFPGAWTKCASYVDLVFARPEFNFHPQHYEQLARRLISQLGAEEIDARAEFCLRRCYYADRSAWGFYLTVFLYGYGRDGDAAQQQWRKGLVALQRGLGAISDVLVKLLSQADVSRTNNES